MSWDEEALIKGNALTEIAFQQRLGKDFLSSFPDTFFSEPPRPWCMNKNLDGLKLTNRNLSRLNFWSCSFIGADLSGCDMSCLEAPNCSFLNCNLSGCNFDYARVMESNFSGSNLTDALLDTAALDDCIFDGANLTGTCLDPNNKPNGIVDGFERCEDYVIGYRAGRSLYMNHIGPRHGYLVGLPHCGSVYKSNAFSTADRIGHPGLFIAPTIEAIFECCLANEPLYPSADKNTTIIKVKSLASDIHYKFYDGLGYWRTKRFEALEEVGNWNELFNEWKGKK